MDEAGPAPKRLLIIDDDKDLLKLLEQMMGAAGYQVASAEDGSLGLAKVKAFKPSLIILDWMMPKLGGFAVLRRLQNEGHGDIPVVVITGFHESSANEQVIRSEPNVVEFLKKPIKYLELPALFARLLA